MAEPQPPTVHEGAEVEDETPSLPKSAEDRKAAAALSSITATQDDDTTQPAREVDQEALGKAMKNLDVSGTSAAVDGAEKKKKAVKVDQADVSLLVDELDLPKTKATDLLKSHDGDAIKAMEAFVTVSG
ncbi:MAG: hypothetical protein M1825_005262 [Sarcosagium campestre]|nr:MAG: hypothetical protein M1825_005262 [Sarcosagium campestre]